MTDAMIETTRAEIRAKYEAEFAARDAVFDDDRDDGALIAEEEEALRLADPAEVEHDRIADLWEAVKGELKLPYTDRYGYRPADAELTWPSCPTAAEVADNPAVRLLVAGYTIGRPESRHRAVAGTIETCVRDVYRGVRRSLRERIAEVAR